MVETSLASLHRLSAVADRIPGLAWSRDLLALAIRAKFTDEGTSSDSIAGRVVVLAGGTSSESDLEMGPYRAVLLEAFRDFRGTVISDGTVLGVSGLADDLGERYPGAVRTVGYLPRAVPEGADQDERYQELRRTAASLFSPLEPLTYWDELLRGGIRAPKVKLIGIGGGRVAGAEYAIGLSLGATLGIIRGSGGAADRMMSDAYWSSMKRLIPLRPDPEAVRSFLAGR
jgi:hypothetical protein